MQDELEKEHMGKWVLFYKSELVNIYDTFEEASAEAVEKFEAGTYLIRQIGVSSITLPVSVVVNK